MVDIIYIDNEQDAIKDIERIDEALHCILDANEKEILERQYERALMRLRSIRHRRMMNDE